ncbi:DUF2165 family protein [Novosphingobium sp. ZN18A2]|uniref:DUF2165 family protein n=1 Tax=Novosphingobium sp. ZN18A2 TaxID=3079861 RepID=UPI0030D4ED90
MTDRILKALFAVCLGAMALLYVAHNIANVGAAYDFFVYTTTPMEKAAYPVTLLPVPPAPLIVVAMVLVFALEIGAGVFLIWGGFDMWRARNGDTQAFGKAARYAKIGIGCAVVNWWGLFQALAVAGYQLWQKPLGESPFYGSFFYGAMNLLLLIYINQRE